MRKLALLLLCVSACSGGSLHPGAGGGGGGGGGGGVGGVKPPPKDNPIPAENQLPGDPAWKSGFSSPYNHQVEGYLDRVSARGGDTVAVKLSADRSIQASVVLYRLGWYGGAGARLVLDAGSVTLSTQPACPVDSTTGAVRCGWSATLQLAIPTGALSGLYVVRVKRSDGFGILLPLVVRDNRPAEVLFQHSAMTDQAYNSFGGESLYTDHIGIPGHFAVQVSFERPYASGFGSGGGLLAYEQFAAQFLERYGYDVTYASDLDVHREGVQLLRQHLAFLSVGHDEYWTGERRAAADAARDAGVHELFLGANPAYWKTRATDPGPDGNARTITCYKRFPANDPLAATPDRTGRFRDDPIGQPEEKLVGVMYESWMLFGQPWTVNAPSHWLLDGTGFSSGDTVAGLVGYEYDRTFDLGTPAPVDRIARSPVIDAEGRPGTSESTVYVAPSGAMVFGAGTIYWPRGLSGPLRDARIERVTANALFRALAHPAPDALQSIAAPPPPTLFPAWASSVSTVATGFSGPAGVARLPDGRLVVADARDHRIYTVDSSGAVQPLAGDGNPGGSGWDNLPGLQARFYQPTAVAVDAQGVVYVSDTHEHALRRIGTDANHTVTTLAGTIGQSGLVDGVGGTARFTLPMGLAWKDATHLLVADAGNFALRVVDVTTGTVSTFVRSAGGDETDGPAGQAIFFYPTAVAQGPDGRVYFVTSSTGKLKAVGTDVSRTVTTLVAGGLGLADGVGSTAKLSPQGGLVWDGDSLVVSDPGNHRLRRVFPGLDATGTRVQTYAGSGRPSAADGTGEVAGLATPLGLYRAADGTLYLAEGGSGRVRAVKR